MHFMMHSILSWQSHFMPKAHHYIPPHIVGRLPPLPKGSEAADAVVNDNPVDCQSRGMTDPQGEGDRLRWRDSYDNHLHLR